MGEVLFTYNTFNHLDGAIQLDKSQRLVRAERCPKTAASRFTTSCKFTFPRPFSFCTLSLMLLLPGKVDAKLVFGKKPRSWVQDFVNKPLIAIYNRTTFRTRGRLGRFATRGPRRWVLRMMTTTLSGAIFTINYISSSLMQGQESARRPPPCVHGIPPACGSVLA